MAEYTLEEKELELCANGHRYVRYDSKWDSLWDEINSLKATLIAIDNGTKSVNSIAEHTKRISKELKPVHMKQSVTKPNLIHQLLNMKELKNTEIPLDILGMLLSVGTDINEDDGVCLWSAVDNGHYNAAKWLVDHGANCDLQRYVGYYGVVDWEYLITILTRKDDVPLEMFDVLHTPENISRSNKFPLLHLSLSNCKVEYAFRLLELGADVNQTNQAGDQPVQIFISSCSCSCSHEFQHDAFVKLLPSDCFDVFWSTISVGIWCKEDSCKRPSYSMIRQLFQRIVLKEPISVTFRPIRPRGSRSSHQPHSVEVNIHPYGKKRHSYDTAYLCNVILFLLDVEILSAPGNIATELFDETSEKSVSVAHAIDEVWSLYRDKATVKSWYKLCIQRVRKSMNSLDDRSFQSLQVPSHVKGSLMLHDVADVALDIVLKTEDILNKLLYHELDLQLGKKLLAVLQEHGYLC